MRGLKRRQLLRYVRRPAVVPRVGAWIETNIALTKTNGISATVVPRVGAWIETMLPGNNTTFTMWSYPVWVRGLKRIRLRRSPVGGWSYPVWVRGLKLPMMSIDLSAPEVVPRVGAWIET